MPDDFELATVIEQKSHKLMLGGFEVAPSTETSMTYRDFAQISQQKDEEFSSLSIEQIEDMVWEKMEDYEMNKSYAINNEISLFGDDTCVWNLDRFTKSESNIHTTKTHHSQKVSFK